MQDELRGGHGKRADDEAVVLDAEGRIRSMKAYWGQANLVPREAS